MTSYRKSHYLIFYTLFFVLIYHHTFSQYQRYSFTRPKMGSPFNITVQTNDTTGLQDAVEWAYRRVDTLTDIFSDYDESSEIGFLNKYAPKNKEITVSADLMHILKKAKNAYDISGGAFDITVGNIIKLWRKTRKNKTLPSENDLKNALLKTGFGNIQLVSDSIITFDTEGVQLDFGGIVKGYAAQEAVDILTKNNFKICLADAGGDIAVGEKPVNTEGLRPENSAMSRELGGWQIGVNAPNTETELVSKRIKLQKKAVATSGDMYNFVEIDGNRYSHIVNPKTGLGMTHQRNVTVIADDGTTADWLATACSVLSIPKALRLIKKIPNAELLILENKKGKIKIYQSEGFAKYFIY